MKIDIQNKFENKLMNRTEVRFEVTHAGEKTPSRVEIKKLLSANLGADKVLIVLDELHSVYGFGKSKGFALVYENEKDLKKIEKDYLIKRNQPKEEKKEEKPAPASTEPAKESESKSEEESKNEAPVEDKKEESKAEEKPAEKPKEEAK